MGYTVLAVQVRENTFALSYRLCPTDVAHCRALPVLVASISMAAALMESSIHWSYKQRRKIAKLHRLSSVRWKTGS